jgi:CheY-like chemotaxis protein
MMKGNETARLRILLLEDNGFIRLALSTLLRKRGWEVFSYAYPGLCPLLASPGCECNAAEVCADALVTDLEMPSMNGLAFVRALLQKGCRIPNLAMITDSLSHELLAEARAVGFAVFEKSAGVAALVDWLGDVEAKLGADRQLAHWTEA